ncbi:MAG: PilZ domain-containing protein [Nitrospinae bacterium]|nr:PilZ domain-containing protein [Nitrospinota bacterium]
MSAAPGSGPKVAGKRADFRVEMPLMIRYRVAVRQEDGRYQLSPLANGVGVDFSGGGCAFKIAKDIPAGFFLYIEITMPYDKEPVQAVAEVVRNLPDELKGKQVFRCITRYILIHPDVQDRMVGYFIGEAARQKK